MGYTTPDGRQLPIGSDYIYVLVYDSMGARTLALVDATHRYFKDHSFSETTLIHKEFVPETIFTHDRLQARLVHNSHAGRGSTAVIYISNWNPQQILEFIASVKCEPHHIILRDETNSTRPIERIFEAEVLKTAVESY